MRSSGFNTDVVVAQRCVMLQLFLVFAQQDYEAVGIRPNMFLTNRTGHSLSARDRLALLSE